MFDTEICGDPIGRAGEGNGHPIQGDSGNCTGVSGPDVSGADVSDPAPSVSVAGLVAELDRVVSLLGAVVWDGGGDGAGLGDVVVGLSRAKAKLEAAELGASLATKHKQHKQRQQQGQHEPVQQDPLPDTA